MTVLESTMTRAGTMTEAEYRAHPAISYSDLRQMIGCEAAWLAGHRPEESEAMLVGKLFEAEICQDETALAELKADERLYTKKGELRAPFARVAGMVAAWRRQETWQDIAAAQQQVQLFAVLNGVEIKGKPDLWYAGQGIVEDVKTTADIEDCWENVAPWWNVPPMQERARVPWWQASRYDLQAAMYLALLELNDIRPLEYRLRVVTKQEPPDVQWVYLARRDSPDAPWDAAPAVLGAMGYLGTLVDRAALLRARGDAPRPCYRCAYCRGLKRITHPRKGW